METRKTFGFHLGAIFALATLFVALEYNRNSRSESGSDILVDELSQDLELLPAVSHTDMEAVQLPEQQASVTPKINVVEEKETDALEKMNKINDMRIVGETDIDESGEMKTESSKPLTPVVVDQNDNILPLRIVQQLPEYPGGWSAFMQWLTHNLRYPPTAQKQKIEGRVVVTFVVNKDGTLSNIKISKSGGLLFDQEAMRVARMMPKWKPGIDKGQPCRTLMAIPIEFKL